MPRFSVSITEEQNEWVEQEAEARDRSKSEIIRYLIDAHRGEHDQSDLADRDSGEASDLDAQLQQISDRLTALEAALVEDQSQVAESGSQSGQDDKSQAAKTVQSPRRESAVTTEGKTSASTSSAEDQVSQDTKAHHARGRNRDTSITEADGDSTPPEPERYEQEVTEQATDPTATASSAGGSDDIIEAQSSPAEIEASEPSSETSGQSPTDGTHNRNPRIGHGQTESAAEVDSELNESGEESTDGHTKAVSELSPDDTEQIKAEIASRDIDDKLAQSVFTCWEKLRRRGTGDKRVFETVYDHLGDNYETSDDWWADVQTHLDELPGVQPPAGDGRFYRIAQD